MKIFFNYRERIYIRSIYIIISEINIISLALKNKMVNRLDTEEQRLGECSIMQIYNMKYFTSRRRIEELMSTITRDAEDFDIEILKVVKKKGQVTWDSCRSVKQTHFTIQQLDTKSTIVHSSVSGNVPAVGGAVESWQEPRWLSS